MMSSILKGTCDVRLSWLMLNSHRVGHLGGGVEGGSTWQTVWYEESYLGS